MSEQATTIERLRTIESCSLADKIELLKQVRDQGAGFWGSKPPVKRMRFPFTAGALIRSGIRDGLRRYLGKSGTMHTLQEDWGCFESIFFLSLEINTWADFNTLINVLSTFHTFEED